MITQEERKDRLLKANEVMKRLGLLSILVVGNGAVATREYGFYRYFVDNRVYYHRQALVMVADETPTVCCGSLTHLMVLNKRGFQDVRMVGDRLAEGIVDILSDRNITKGRIGYCPETMPASWYDIIQEKYSGLEWVDCTEELYKIRTERSAEESAIAEKCAVLALAGYATIIVANYIPVVKRTGMTTSSLDIPQYILYYAMPIGFGLMVFWSIVNIAMDIKKLKKGGTDPDDEEPVSMKTE